MYLAPPCLHEGTNTWTTNNSKRNKQRTHILSFEPNWTIYSKNMKEAQRLWSKKNTSNCRLPFPGAFTLHATTAGEAPSGAQNAAQAEEVATWANRRFDGVGVVSENRVENQRFLRNGFYFCQRIFQGVFFWRVSCLSKDIHDIPRCIFGRFVEDL